MEGTNDDEKKTSYRRQRGSLGMPTVKGGLRLRPRPSRHKDCGPQPARLGWGPQSKTTCLSFHRNGYRFGELKRQVTLGRERGYVLFILCIRFALRLSTVFGIVFGLVFRGLSHRVGFQLVGFSAEFDRSESYLQFFLLDGNDAADHFRALGNHGLSLYRDGRGEARGKGITNVVLVAGEGLAYRRADGCAFRHGDQRGCLWCLACDAGRLRCLGFLGSGSSLIGGLVRAACYSQEACSCHSKPKFAMDPRVEHFVPPKGYPGSESKEVAGLSPSPGKTTKPANRGYSLLV